MPIAVMGRDNEDCDPDNVQRHIGARTESPGRRREVQGTHVLGSARLEVLPRTRQHQRVSRKCR